MRAARPVPALLGAILVAVVLAVGTGVAISAPTLPRVSADELVASLLEAHANPPPVSGELAGTLGLGLPALPDNGRGGDDDDGLASLLGDTRLRLERSADGVRAAVLDSRSERLFVSDGDTAVLWNSRTLEATRIDLPERSASDGRHSSGKRPHALDPQHLAARLVAAAEERGAVSVDGTARVAGRDAYRLALVPDDPGTTLGRAEIDVDAETRTALRVALYAAGAEQASIELAWTQVSYEPIDPATFTFTPPPGSTVTDKPLPSNGQGFAPSALGALAGPVPGRLVGTGLAAVAVVPLPDGFSAGNAEALLPLDGPLLSARLATADRGPVLLAGLVPLARLDEVAAELR